jgi:hypothetical protein
VVDVYSRGEDLPETRTRIGGDEMSSIGNPSSRRSGLNIGFYCENCPRLFWLRIEQHKGETYLSAERGLLREVDDEPTAAADSETVPTAPESIEHILRQV